MRKISIMVRPNVVLLVLLSVLTAGVNGADETGDYIHYRLGVKYKNERKYDRAIDEFRKVLAAYSDNYNAYFHMAEIREAQNRPRLVIYNLKKALSYNPGWSRAQKMLAKAYEKDGQFQKAIVELQQYQQGCDPAERDSVQQQIDRLITVVSGTTVEKTGEDLKTGPPPSPKETSTQDKPEVAATTVAPGAPRKSSVKTKKSGSRRSPSDASVNALFEEAVELYNSEKFDASLKKLKQVIAKHPGHPGAYYYAGLIRFRKKQMSMARINLIKGLSYNELGHNAHFYLGKIYGGDRQYAKAISHLFKYIEKATYEPAKKEAQQLIEAYRQKGGAAVLDAIAPGKTVSSLPTDTMMPKERYQVLEVRIDSLLTMLTVDTLSDAGQKLLGGIHEFTGGNFDKAIREFRKVLADHPSGTVAVHCLYNTGICYLKLRLFREAENQFQQVLQRYGRHPVAAKCLFFKAVTYLERSETVTAEKLFRSFIKQYRNHEWISNAWEKLGDAYVDLEQHKKAVDAYRNAVRSSTRARDQVAVLFKCGKAYKEIGNSKRAIESYEKAIRIGEKADVYLRVPDSYYRIADEWYKLKEFKKAFDYYRKVTRKFPAFQETPWGLFQIGSIYKNEKKYQQAVKVFKVLMKKYPDDYWARQAQFKMEDAIWEHEYKAVLR